MAEIYRDSVNLGITLDIPSAIVTKAVFKRDGVSTDGVTSGRTVALPYAITHMDGPFQIEWTYTVEAATYTRVDTHEVITPLFTQAELLDDDPQFATLSDKQVVKLEAMVRGIIEAYTGQTFGFRKGYVDVYGNGDSTLNSSERIISLDPIMNGYRAVNSGYAIEQIGHDYTDLNIKVPAEEEAYNAVIHSPSVNRVPLRFANNAKYRISGTFGWESVPTDVKRAALILAEAFSCDESMWQDRYIKSIRAADWRFDFGDGAFIGTGSYSADQLLSKYIVNRLAVV